MKKHHHMWFMTALAAFCLFSQALFANQAKDQTSSVSTILAGLEKRYQSPAFSARFYQESPLPDIQITEKAEGKAFFERPGKFRWSYETPDVLDYICDGSRLWIHSPAENSVWVGTSEDFFGKTGSAAVLTDLKQLQERFKVSVAEAESDKEFRLKLLPKEKDAGLTHLFLSIDKSTFNILKIVSFNMNGEETRISFDTMTFLPDADDGLFVFKVPKKAIVIPLN